MRQFHPTLSWCTEHRDRKILSVAFGTTGKYRTLPLKKECSFVEAITYWQKLVGKKFDPDQWYFATDGITIKILSPLGTEGRYKFEM